MKFCKGFYLLEILSVLAIIAIIASLSLPVYKNYLIDARRSEAKSALLNLALAMEQYYVKNHTYEHATLLKLNLSEYIANNNYHLIIQSASDNQYMLSAKPQGMQAKKDLGCSSLFLKSDGSRTQSGSGSLEECWG